ncbi:MAG: TOBE domain-containing protein [Actinomycetota bacterium]
MSEFRIGQAAALLGVSVDTVRRWADSGRLPSRRTEGGHRVVDGAALAQLATEFNETAAGENAIAQSARNRFGGIVTRVIRNEVTAQVEIQSGRHRLVSLMTSEAVDELGLEPGVMAVAAVKATTVVVELPPSA